MNNENRNEFGEIVNVPSIFSVMPNPSTTQVIPDESLVSSPTTINKDIIKVDNSVFLAVGSKISDINTIESKTNNMKVNQPTKVEPIVNNNEIINATPTIPVNIPSEVPISNVTTPIIETQKNIETSSLAQSLTITPDELPTNMGVNTQITNTESIKTEEQQIKPEIDAQQAILDELNEYGASTNEEEFVDFSRADIVNNYNNDINTNNIDDSFNISVEDQLNNSKDINIYKQSGTKNIPPSISNIDIPAQVFEPKPDENNKAIPIMPQPTKEVVNYMPKDNLLKNNNLEVKKDKDKSGFNKLIFALLWVAIIVGIIFAGYSFLMNRNDFYLGKSDITIATGSEYMATIYTKGKINNNKDYKWEVDNKVVVDVNEEGLIKATKAGKTTITITHKKTKQSQIMTVNVIDVEIKQFTVAEKEKVTYIGNPYTIVPTINGQSNIIMNLVWISEDESIATVDNNGIVKPKKAGKTRIIVMVPNTEYKAVVTIFVEEKNKSSFDDFFNLKKYLFN